MVDSSPRVFHLVLLAAESDTHLPPELRIFLTQNVPPLNGFQTFSLGNNITFKNDPFMPTTLPGVARFVMSVLASVHVSRNRSIANIAFLSDQGPAALTNSVFLMGAFLILVAGRSSKEVSRTFQSLNKSLLAPLPVPLKLGDLWSSIERAREKGWFVLGKNGAWEGVNLTKMEDKVHPHFQIIPGSVVLDPNKSSSQLPLSSADRFIKMILRPAGISLVGPEAIPFVAIFLVKENNFSSLEAMAWILLTLSHVLTAEVVQVLEGNMLCEIDEEKELTPPILKPRPPLLRSNTMPNRPNSATLKASNPTPMLHRSTSVRAIVPFKP